MTWVRIKILWLQEQSLSYKMSLSSAFSNAISGTYEDQGRAIVAGCPINERSWSSKALRFCLEGQHNGGDQGSMRQQS